MRALHGKVAVVTGAASGIGRETSLHLAREGCIIALADVDAEALAVVAEQIRRLGGRASVHITDVAKKQSVEELGRAVLARHKHVHLLMNNAGVTVVDLIRTGTVEDLEWILGVNFWGVVHGCRTFLPHLLAEDEAHIVNVSSVYGFVGMPSQSYYSATKFAVRGFTEALCVEMQGTPVRVSCVFPGGVTTSIARTARFGTSWTGDSRDETVAGFEHTARSSVAQAAATIVRGIKRNKRRILIGYDSRVVDLLARITPAFASSIIAALVKRSQRRNRERRQRPT